MNSVEIQELSARIEDQTRGEKRTVSPAAMASSAICGQMK